MPLIPETFSVSSSKMTYLIPEGVGPYFNTRNIEHVRKSSSPFIIHDNEQTTNRSKNSLELKQGIDQKQIQLLKCII